MQSCLYRGTVSHQRLTPVEHRFKYHMDWCYFDLDETESLVSTSRWLGQNRFGVASFCRNDHVGPTNQSLADSIRDLVRPSAPSCSVGAVRLLTQLRQWGFYFSPLNLYFCFDTTQQPEQLCAVVAEVSNTPWNERHHYILVFDKPSVSGNYAFRHPKQFHVSPFMEMELDYEWRITRPSDSLHLSLRCIRTYQAPEASRTRFFATMQLRRLPLDDRHLAAMTLRYPFAALQILGKIHWQAFRLWRKKCIFHPHPNKRVEKDQTGPPSRRYLSKGDEPTSANIPIPQENAEQAPNNTQAT